MTDLPLAGDAEALYMACPSGPAAQLAAQLSAMSPPGPLLELCCGVGGLTRELARELARAGREVVAVDQSLERLQANRANLAALGLERRVSYLCCDLRRPALRAPEGPPSFAASLLDPDWSPPEQTPDQWTGKLANMDPPADELIRLGLELSSLVVIRLPRAIRGDSLKSVSPGLVSRKMGVGGKGWRWMALQKGLP